MMLRPLDAQEITLRQAVALLRNGNNDRASVNA